MRWSNLQIVRFLISEMSKYVSIKEIADDRTANGNTPIHFAAYDGHQAIVDYFLTDLNCDLNIKGEKRNSTSSLCCP